MKARRLIAAVVATLALTPTLALGADSDKDGLPNRWEKKRTPDGLNLKRLGANRLHKDVFVEVEFANGIDRADVPCSQLDALFQVFKSAPVANPDGKSGITLHLDAGITCPSRKYDLGGSSRFALGNPPCANPSDISNTLAPKRLTVFHIAGVVTEEQLCGAEGIASGSDFMLKVTGGGGFAHVFMHELGHVFGLDHGSVNSYSVMSKVLNSFPAGQTRLDYNRYPVAALNEASLSEPAGLQSTPAGEAYLHGFYSFHYCGGFSGEGPADANIDWDCEGAPFYMPPQEQYIDEDPVQADIDGDGQITVIPAAPAEWPLLQHGAGRIGG